MSYGYLYCMLWLAIWNALFAAVTFGIVMLTRGYVEETLTKMRLIYRAMDRMLGDMKERRREEGRKEPGTRTTNGDPAMPVSDPRSPNQEN